jgi:hypothetical protein
LDYKQNNETILGYNLVTKSTGMNRRTPLGELVLALVALHSIIGRVSAGADEPDAYAQLVDSAEFEPKKADCNEKLYWSLMFLSRKLSEDGKEERGMQLEKKAQAIALYCYKQLSNEAEGVFKSLGDHAQEQFLSFARMEWREGGSESAVAKLRQLSDQPGASQEDTGRGILIACEQMTARFGPLQAAREDLESFSTSSSPPTYFEFYDFCKALFGLDFPVELEESLKSLPESSRKIVTEFGAILSKNGAYGSVFAMSDDDEQKRAVSQAARQFVDSQANRRAAESNLKKACRDALKLVGDLLWLHKHNLVSLDGPLSEPWPAGYDMSPFWACDQLVTKEPAGFSKKVTTFLTSCCGGNR